MVNVKLLVMGLSTVALGLGATGCATSSVSKTVKSAPIQYKVGDGVAQYASLSTPRRPMTSTVPDSYIPARPVPARPRASGPRASRPAPARPAPARPLPARPLESPQSPQAPQRFDQASVDSDLYKHQRVGKRYTIMGKSYTPKHDPDYDVTGVASWYGDKFHGKPTATGETYDMNDMTAAHKTLPLNSMLFVTNVENGKTVMVRLNDRGPFVGDRIIDLSKASANALGITGLGQVRVQYAGPADPMAASRAPVRAPVEVPRPVQEEHAEAPAALPQAAPAIPFTPPTPAPRVPAAPVAPTAPQALGNADDTAPEGQVTLTIKGPIHVAKHTGQSARLVRERLNTK